MENVVLLWTKEMMQMLGFSWHPVEGKTQKFLNQNRQFTAKAKREDTMVHVRVCTHSKRT